MDKIITVSYFKIITVKEINFCRMQFLFYSFNLLKLIFDTEAFYIIIKLCANIREIFEIMSIKIRYFY